MINKISKLFPLWAIIFALAAYVFPGLFSPYKNQIIPLLIVVMFGMGMTLTWDNFLNVFKMPATIFFGVILQYLIMPFAAIAVARIFSFSPALIAGIVLVGVSPGGTASNVICYLGNADVALSITLTTTNTLVAVFATPVFAYLFLHQIVPVPFWKMLFSIAEIVVVPVLLGTTVNSLAGSKIEKLRAGFPLLSMLAILLIIAIIVALNKSILFKVDTPTIISVFILNTLGYTLGYFIPKLFKYDEKTCRTIGIEVGMQNSGLSVALAVKYFSAVAALPGAIFSVWQNISGPILAGYWRIRDKNNKS